MENINFYFVVIGISYLVFLFLCYFLIKKVTRLRRLIDNASLSQTVYQQILDTIPMPVIVYDSNYLLKQANMAFYQVVDKRAEELLNQDIIVIIKNFFDMDTEQVLSNTIAHHSKLIQTPYVNFLRLSDGKREVDVLLWITVLRTEYKRSFELNFVCGWFHLTDSQWLLYNGLTYHQFPKNFDHHFPLLLSTVSHEIRNPVSTIIGLVELQQKQNQISSGLQKDYLSSIYDTAKQIQMLLDRLLEDSRLGINQQQLQCEPVELKIFLSDLLKTYAPLAAAKQLQLVSTDFSTLIDNVYMDTVRLRQVLSNLLSNAIKFTHQGVITLSCEVERLPDYIELTLSLQDSGIGICQEDLPNLFGPFVQVERSESHQGVGLGLAISKDIIEMMGGTISVKSEPGKGTCFIIQLALTLAELPDRACEKESLDSVIFPPTTKIVLVVEDSAVNHLILTSQLEHLGYRVITANNGEQGLQIWRQQAVDIIITDLSMPVMGGLEMVSIIRQRESEEQLEHCRIIALTASPYYNQAELCLLGIAQCLIKPTSLEALHAALSCTTVPSVFSSSEPLSLSKKLQSVFGEDVLAMQGFLQTLIDTNCLDLNTIQQIWAERNLCSLVEIIHKIKGVHLLLEATDVVRCCKQIEQLLAEQQLDKIPDLLQQLDDEIRLLHTNLGNIYSAMGVSI